MVDLTLPDGSPILPSTHDQRDQEFVETGGAPTDSKSLWFLVRYGLANSVIGLGTITLSTLLLPSRLRVLAPTSQTTTFLLLSSLGAVAMNILLAALSAILPDQVPLTQRATVSTFGAMAPLVGGLAGQMLVSQVIQDDTRSFLILGLLAVALLLVFCLELRDERLPQGMVSPFRLKDLLRTYWSDLTRSPLFARIWLARCCVFLACTTVVNSLYSFLLAVHLFSGQQIVLLVSSLVCGMLSDRLQRRKLFVVGPVP
jgi:MFS family permease